MTEQEIRDFEKDRVLMEYIKHVRADERKKVLAEIEALNQYRYIDKKNHDAIHWLHVRSLLTRIKGKT